MSAAHEGNDAVAALGLEHARWSSLLREAAPALCALLATHRALWALEDRARSQRAHDREIAEIKRQIDVKNAARHGLIDVLDAALLQRAGTAACSGRRYSETPGELIDRLLILALKIESVAALALDAGLAPDERERCAQRLRLQQRRRAHLQACLSEQLADHAAGRAEVVPRAEFKLYNDRRFNPVLRGERVESS